MLEKSEPKTLKKALLTFEQQSPRMAEIVNVINRNSQNFYAECVLKFLGLSENSNQDFEVKNSAKKRKSMLIWQAVLLLGNIKRRLGIKKSFGILTMINNQNAKYRTRRLLDVEMRSKLQDYFHEDITLLESLLGKDLSSWKKK
jgi:predicted nuclease of predicted toxin-antitoxin system